jgi:hypothetical protein
VKKFKKEKSEGFVSELENFVNKLEKKELEGLIQKSVKTLDNICPLKDGLSNNLPTPSKNLKLKKDELKKVPPLIKSQKPSLSECFRGSYKNLKKEGGLGNKITKSLPILKLDNDIIFDNKK